MIVQNVLKLRRNHQRISYEMKCQKNISMTEWEKQQQNLMLEIILYMEKNMIGISFEILSLKYAQVQTQPQS